MGRPKTETVTQTVEKNTPTKEETELNKLSLERARAGQEGQIQTQALGTDLINQLLSGQALPGYLQGLPQGISDELAGDISQKAVQDLLPSFQSSGILDSGVAASVSGQVAGDIRRGAAESNMNNLFNLLNLAVGGQAQIQQPLLAQSAQLGQQLAGLRTRTSTGSSTQTAPNPFTQSFFKQAGSDLGRGAVVGGLTFLGGCWVASELFGGWYEPKTCAARNFVANIGPKWFREIYLKYGERFANYISDKPVLKFIVKPIFEVFAWIGGKDAK